MESGGKSRWMTKRTTTQLWRYCRFGLIRPSIRIYFSIWTSRLFEALRCSRACEIPWDRVQPCVGKKMSYFRPCLPQNRWRYWNVICGGTFSLKSKIHILNHWVLAVKNRFYNSCQNPSLSNSAAWEVHGLSVYQPYYHHSVKKSLLRGVLVRCRGTDATLPLSVPHTFLSTQVKHLVCVPRVIAEEESGGVFSPSRTSQAATGHVGAVRVNNVRCKRLFDRPRRNSVWPNPGASGLFNSGICRCIHTPADISICSATKVLKGFCFF